MTPTALRDQFRNFVSDKIPPFLWSDSEIFFYMDQAQKMFCRMTEGLYDSTSSQATEVAVTANQPFSSLHPSILVIRQAIRADGKPLQIVNYNDFRVKNQLDTTLISDIEYMVLGEQENLCRWYPIPSADTTVKLHVQRLPLETITEISPSFEIPQHHVFSLMFYMAYMAYNKQEADAFNPDMSSKMFKEFVVYCESVRLEKEKSKYKPRSVVYGGI